MTDAVIVSTARTGLAKSWRGALNMTHGATMGGHVVKHAIERAKIDPAEVEDVLMGCATPEGATGANIARQIALRAGCPVTTAGATVNRFCSWAARFRRGEFGSWSRTAACSSSLLGSKVGWEAIARISPVFGFMAIM